jgi:hypothetical protein
MVTGQAHDDKSTAQNGVFYRTDASQWFWSSINNLISQLLWQFYIFVNNDALQLEKPELDPNVVQAKAWSTELTNISKAKASSGKHLRRLLGKYKYLETERANVTMYFQSHLLLLKNNFLGKVLQIFFMVINWKSWTGEWHQDLCA